MDSLMATNFCSSSGTSRGSQSRSFKKCTSEKKMVSLSLHARRTWFNWKEYNEIKCCFSSAIKITGICIHDGKQLRVFFNRLNKNSLRNMLNPLPRRKQSKKQSRSFPHNLKSLRSRICTQLDLRNLLKAGYVFLFSCQWYAASQHIIGTNCYWKVSKSKKIKKIYETTTSFGMLH